MHAESQSKGGGKRERTRAFTELVSHYLFKDRSVRCGKGQRLGSVEEARKNMRERPSSWQFIFRSRIQFPDGTGGRLTGYASHYAIQLSTY